MDKDLAVQEAWNIPASTLEGKIMPLYAECPISHCPCLTESHNWNTIQFPLVGDWLNYFITLNAIYF